MVQENIVVVCDILRMRIAGMEIIDRTPPTPPDRMVCLIRKLTIQCDGKLFNQPGFTLQTTS